MREYLENFGEGLINKKMKEKNEEQRKDEERRDEKEGQEIEEDNNDIL